MPTLYGRGAVVLSDDRHQYRPVNGVLTVPAHMVQQAKGAGFTEYPLPTVDGTDDDASAAPTGAAPNATLEAVDGRTQRLTLARAGAQSYRIGLSRHQLPPDAAVAAHGHVLHANTDGTCVATFEEVVEPGDSLCVTIVPFTGPGGAGSRLPAIYASLTETDRGTVREPVLPPPGITEDPKRSERLADLVPESINPGSMTPSLDELEAFLDDPASATT